MDPRTCAFELEALLVGTSSHGQGAFVDSLADAVIVCEGTNGPDGRIRFWSTGAERFYGWSANEVIGRPLHEVLGFDLQSSATWWEQISRDGAGASERVYATRAGQRVHVHASITLLYEDQQPAGFVLVSSEISSRRTTELARREIEERYSVVVASLEEGVLVCDPAGRAVSANAAACNILQLERGELLGLDLAEGPWQALDAQQRPFPKNRWPHRTAPADGSSAPAAVIGLRRSRGVTWIRVKCRALRDEDSGAVTSFACSLSDITETKTATDRLAWAATHDSLTALSNRAGIAKYLERADGDGDANLAVFFVDLDRFKMVNDSLGHSAGDMLLRSVALRLSEAVRGVTDVVGRLAGDEFVVICPGCFETSRAVAVAKRLLEVLEEPVEVTDAHGKRRTVTVNASIGVAFSGPGHPATESLDEADAAMYAAKERGRGRVEVFDRSLREAAKRRLAIQEDLREALATGGLSLAYQPIVTLPGDRAGGEGSCCGAVIGYEALARWVHPEHGPIPPDEFIPVAEEAGLIAVLGTWVLQEATRAAARWRSAGVDAYVTVNLSARQVVDPELVSNVKRALVAAGLAPEGLVLEITESSLMGDPRAAKDAFFELKQLGVRLSIDDFGTGYSSLAYLDRFPVDVLKIDRSFVASLGSGEPPRLVAGIISLGRLLDLAVVAEGVETKEQAEVLAELGATALQGYLCGRPGEPPA